MLLHALAVLDVHRARLARGGLRLGQDVVILSDGAVDALLEDGLGFVELELGLEVVQVVGVATAVGTTARVAEVELLVDYFLADITPIAFASTVLLCLLGVDALEAILGEEFGEAIMWKDGTLCKTSVVLVVELVRSSHFDESGRRYKKTGW
jgi:hypothetical protein